jgi:hypothetical protein
LETASGGGTRYYVDLDCQGTKAYTCSVYHYDAKEIDVREDTRANGPTFREAAYNALCNLSPELERMREKLRERRKEEVQREKGKMVGQK